MLITVNDTLINKVVYLKKGIDFTKIIRDRGFKSSLRDLARIEGLSSNQIRLIYKTNKVRFYDILDRGILKWNWMVKK